MIVAIGVVLTGIAGAAAAQTSASSGQVVGQVVDGSGAAIFRAAVSVRNHGTNAVRRTTTDSAGRYAVSGLAPGGYEVTAIAQGFERAAADAAVTLGSTATADLTMTVGGVSEAVEVGGRNSALEPTGTQGKAVLTALQLENLPAAGRRVRSLFLLTPATQIEPECGGFAISGQKGLFANISVDGGDYTNTHWCGHVEFSPTFSIEAIEEFQVLRSTFSAEFGRSTGGIINMATKSGSNQLRGTGFYLFRNDALTRRDPFGRQAIGLGQQFGGSIGGAIRKDRTFFFVAPEVQHNTKPVQVLYTALDAQNLRGTAAAGQLLATAPEQRLEALSQSQSVVTRLDHHLTDRHTLMGRFDYIRNRVTDNIGSVIMSQGLGADSITNRAVSNQVFLTNRNDVTGMAQLSSVLSNRFLNEARVQVTHEYRPWNTSGSGPEVTVRNLGTTVAIYGPQATGLSYGNIGYRFNDVRYQVTDNLSFVTGSHTAKVGVDSNLVNGRTTFAAGANGIYTFNSLADFAARRPFSYSQFAGSGALDTTMQQVAFYAQDEWRLRPGLAISPGFRYEMALLPGYVAPTVAANRFPAATAIPDDKELIAPRLGLVWNPGDSGRTVVRAAAGVFYAAPYMPVFEQSILGNGGNPELSSLITIPTNINPNAVTDAFGQFGIDLANAAADRLPVFAAAQLNQLVAPSSRVGQTINYIDPAFRLPRAVQSRIAVERQLARGIVATVDFTNINTDRIARVRNINLTPPVPDATGRPVYTAARPYRGFGVVQVTESKARSNYHGLSTSLSVKRQRVAFDLYYTLGYSRSADDTERGISSVVFDDAYDLANEYSWSNIDQRHQFAGNTLLYLPKQIELSATIRANSGRPFSALAGTDLNKDGVVRDRAVIDGRVVARNTFRNRGFSQLDLRLQHGFALPAGSRGVLSLELFNVTNQANVEIGSANMVYGAGTTLQNGVPVSVAPPVNFGQIRDASGNYRLNSTLRTAPFQAQLGLRFQF